MNPPKLHVVLFRALAGAYGVPARVAPPVELKEIVYPMTQEARDTFKYTLFAFME